MTNEFLAFAPISAAPAVDPARARRRRARRRLVAAVAALLLLGGSLAAAREKGLVRSEGKEYVMQDGDVVLFRCNV